MAESSLLQHRDSPRAEALRQRVLALPTDEVAVTAATLEEQARSWISLIGRYYDVRQQVAYYARFVAMFRSFSPVLVRARESAWSRDSWIR